LVFRQKTEIFFFHPKKISILGETKKVMVSNGNEKETRSSTRSKFSLELKLNYFAACMLS